MSPAELRARALERVGTSIRDKWSLDGLLGVGGTAAVYAATHRNGKRAALKILRQELIGSRELVTRFVREGYVANRLEHPSVCAILDDDTTEDGAPFLVMELLEGHSLERHTRAHALLPMAQVVDLMDQVLDVLTLAHENGIVHRDIKPANLFLTQDERLKVLDFGIARMQDGLDASMTQTGTAIGTPSYMPPEQARGRWKQVDARTDVWAAGATMFALLAGMKPRRAETVQEELLSAMTEPVPSLHVVCNHVPRSLAAVVDRALAFEREHRFPSARAMQDALRDVAHELGLAPPSTSPRIPLKGGTLVLPNAAAPDGRVSPVPSGRASVPGRASGPRLSPFPGRVSAARLSPVPSGAIPSAPPSGPLRAPPSEASMTPISHVGQVSGDPLGTSAPAPSLLESGLRVAPGVAAPRASPVPEAGTMSPAVSNLADARALAGAAETPRAEAMRPWALPLAIVALVISAVGMFFVGRVVFRPASVTPPTSTGMGPASKGTGPEPSTGDPSTKGPSMRPDVLPTARADVTPGAITVGSSSASTAASALRGQPSPPASSVPPPMSASRPSAAGRAPLPQPEGIHRQR